MTSTIFICSLLFLGGIRTTKIGINENQDLSKDLKTCLSTAIETLWPDCETLHLVIPVKSAREADALAIHFSESSRMYAIAMYTMDRPGYEDSSIDQIDFYTVNTEVDLKMALKHLPATKSGRSCVVLVNFYFGRNLGNYLQRTIPVTWKSGRKRRVVFVALIEGSVQVFGTPFEGSGSSNFGRFRQLSICDTNGLIEIPQPLSKVIESQKSTITVTMGPKLRPYIERRTDNPGGIIGQFMKVMESEFNFTIKYDWSVRNNFSKFIKKDGLRVAFDMFNNPKPASRYPIPFLGGTGVWVIAIPDLPDQRNILAMPFKSSMLLHLVLLIIYTIVMVYFSRDLDKTRIMLRLFGMFFGVGVGWLPKKALYRLLVMLWCFTSYNVLVQAYLAALASDLSIPFAQKSFQDTKDLMESGIDIFCLESTKELYCNFETEPDVYICEKCMISQGNWSERFLNKEYRMNKTWRPFAISIDSLVLSTYFEKNSISVMKDKIGAWPGMIYSNLDTELMEKMMRTAEVLHEAGIFQLWLSRYSIKNFTTAEHGILTMRNLNGVFIILYIGWSCSIIIFLVELLMNWYRNK